MFVVRHGLVITKTNKAISTKSYFTLYRTMLEDAKTPLFKDLKENTCVPSTYKIDYKAYGVQPRYQHPQAQYIKNDSKFNGTTTNANDFTDKGLPERYHHQGPKYIKNEAKFDGTTTNSNDFIDRGIPERFVHQGAKFIKNEAKFEGTTTNGKDYSYKSKTFIFNSK